MSASEEAHATADEAGGAGPSNGPDTAIGVAQAAAAAAASSAAGHAEHNGGGGGGSGSAAGMNGIEPPPMFAGRGIKQRVSYFYDRECVCLLYCILEPR
jgi:hypothetical protein